MFYYSILTTSGTGPVGDGTSVGNAAYDISSCAKSNFGVSYNAASQPTYVLFTGNTYSPCGGPGTPNGRLDPVTFAMMPGIPTGSSWWSHARNYVTGLNGQLYANDWRNNLRRLDIATNNWVTIAGGGSTPCVDGTLATACSMNLQDIFVSATGSVYLLESNKVRTILRNSQETELLAFLLLEQIA